jgi:hypothetical protein
VDVVEPARPEEPSASSPAAPTTRVPVRVQRVALVAAGLLAVAGVVAAAVHDDHDRCDALRAELTGLGYRPTAAQRWDDIVVLQETVAEGLRVKAEFDDAGCTW